MTSSRYIVGDCREVMAEMPEQSVQCVVTSPPYWGLRDYQVDGALGLEKAPEEYLERMVAVFREVRRVLRDDGTLWLNIGDSYNNTGPGSRDPERWPKQSRNDHRSCKRQTPDLKPKDLCMMPARLAMALQADGWYLRCDIIWSKPNPMPESVTDRPTKAHEYVFLLGKSAKYYYDADAVREPQTELTLGRLKTKEVGLPGSKNKERTGKPFFGMHRIEEGGRNLRSVWTVEHTCSFWRFLHHNLPEDILMSLIEKWAAGQDALKDVWTIATQKYAEAHFATFPERLVTPCVLAGSGPKACPHCGAAWVSDVEISGGTIGMGDWNRGGKDTGIKKDVMEIKPELRKAAVDGSYKRQYRRHKSTCACPDNDGSAKSIVLDPFAGTNMTGYVARKHGRDSIAIDLKEEYRQMAERRLQQQEIGV